MIVRFGGSVVLRDRDGEMIGAVGISGGSVEEEEIVAQAVAVVILD
ncbi:uncharacterized protein GlcG (DUF336 family) [Bradyrhizobium sp. USDA 4501]